MRVLFLLFRLLAVSKGLRDHGSYHGENTEIFLQGNGFIKDPVGAQCTDDFVLRFYGHTDE